MDRNIVYPGSIPLDTDLLSLNRNVMVALGYLIQSVIGQNAVVDGLVCQPTVPPSMTVSVGPGSIVQPTVIDTLAYGSLPADVTDPLLKMGVNTTATEFTLIAPSSSGESANFLIEASFQESDVNPIVLPYYNASNPSQPYSGPANAGTTQNTLRSQRVALQLKPGAPALTGTQLTPPVDSGWVGLYVVTVSYSQTAVTATNISVPPGAPFINWKLPSLVPGFAAGVQTFSNKRYLCGPERHHAGGGGGLGRWIRLLRLDRQPRQWRGRRGWLCPQACCRPHSRSGNPCVHRDRGIGWHHVGFRSLAGRELELWHLRQCNRRFTECLGVGLSPPERWHSGWRWGRGRRQPHGIVWAVSADERGRRRRRRAARRNAELRDRRCARGLPGGRRRRSRNRSEWNNTL